MFIYFKFFDDKMERKLMLLLLSTLSFLILLNKVDADECGDRCTSTQICRKDDGKCYEKANLKTCISLTSIYRGHYCLQTQDCCDDGCIPKNAVCCRFFSKYCPTNYTCCSFGDCCPPGTFCKGFSCINDKYSTQKPTTASPPSTAKPRTTSKPKPVTRYPPRTTRWYENRTQRSYTSVSSKSTLKPWVYAIIVIVVIGVITFVVVVALMIRRRKNNALQGQTGGRGIVINAPPQIYGQTDRSNVFVATPGVPTQTHKPSPQINVAYIATKPAAPVPVTVNNKNKNNKTTELFSL